METLVSNEFIRLGRERGSSLLRYVRTPVAYRLVTDVAPAHREVIRLLDTLGRERHVMLVDLREAPANNDPAFEQSMAGVRVELLRGLARVAILVRSAAGALQLSRHGREDSRDRRVFHGDPDAAISYLSADAPQQSPSRRGAQPITGGA
jgi:hypothetical protein